MKALLNLNYGNSPRDRRGPPRHCDAPGCVHPTREGKAYCSDHVEMQPYAQWVMAQLEAREKEVNRVKKRGQRAVPMSSETTRDILGYIVERGTCSIERLRRERMHDVEEDVVEKYVLALERKGLVSLSQTARGSTTVSVTGATPGAVA